MESSSQLQGAKMCKKDMVSSWEHFTKILSNLRKASDIRINCMKGNSTTVVLANRCVLEACSLQFTKLYENKQQEQGNVCHRSVINDLGSSLNELDTVIDFIYSGIITLTLDNVCSVLHLAGYFKIETLLDTCCAYIKCSLKEDTYLHLSLVLFKNEVAVKMNKKLTNLKKELEEYVRSHVCELIQSHYIYKFSAEDILLLLKAGCLSKMSDVGAMCQFAYMMLTRVQDTDAVKIALMTVKYALADVGNMSTADKLLLHSHLLTLNETALKCYGKEVFGESVKMLNDILGVKTEQEKDISDADEIKDTINIAGIPVSKKESVHNIGSVSESKISPKLEDIEQTSVVTGAGFKPFDDNLAKKTGQEIDIIDEARRERATRSLAIVCNKNFSVNAIDNVSDKIRTSTTQDKSHLSLVVDFRKVPQDNTKDKRKDSGVSRHNASLQLTLPGTVASTKDLSVSTSKVLNDVPFSTAASTTSAQLSSKGTKVDTVVGINDKNVNRTAANSSVREKNDTNEHIYDQQADKYFIIKTESDDVPMISTIPNTVGELVAVTEEVVNVKIEPVDTWTETSDYDISSFKERNEKYTEIFCHDGFLSTEKNQFVKFEKDLPPEGGRDMCSSVENVEQNYIETEIKVEKVYAEGFQEGNEQQSFSKHLTSAVNETGGYKESYCENKKLCTRAQESPQNIPKEYLKRKENKDTHVTHKKMKILNTFEDVRKMDNLSTSKSSNQNSKKAKELKKVSVIPKSRIKVVKR